MKNYFLKGISALIVVMLLTLSVSITSNAEFATHSDDVEDLYLTEYDLTIEQGGSEIVSIHSTNYISYFIVGAHSNGTYVTLKNAGAGFDMEVHVGIDETTNEFNIYIYLDGTPGYYKTLCVGVTKVYTYNPDSQINTSTLIKSLQVPYANNTVGLLNLINDNKTGFFYTAEGLPIAQFSVYADNGQIRVLQLGQVISTDTGAYVTVNTTTPGTIHISESDKAALQAFGVNGLILNGVVTLWP